MSEDLPIGTEPSTGRFEGLYRGHMERREKVKMDVGSSILNVTGDFIVASFIELTRNMDSSALNGIDSTRKNTSILKAKKCSDL